MQRAKIVAALAAIVLAIPPSVAVAAPEHAAQSRPATIAPPPSFLSGWVQVDRFPLGFKLSTFVARMIENHTAIRWEKGSPGWILRGTTVDQLTQRKHNLGFVFTEVQRGPNSMGDSQDTQLLLTAAVVDEQEFVGSPLAAFANMTFRDLIGRDLDPALAYPSREAYKADCPNRVAKKKAETAAQVAEWRRQGTYIPGWLDNGPDNRFDLSGNIFEQCEARQDSKQPAEPAQSPAPIPTPTAIDTGSNPAAPARLQARTGTCRLTVGGKRYIDGQCSYLRRANGGFIVEGPHTSYEDGFAAALSLRDQITTAFWNGPNHDPDGDLPLGTMTRRGACWSNTDNELCLWP
ncbi:hypothetical protein [Sphingomonas sp.]|uniref:hypothetical protein n=1 Tax=Sphingomonas sp. TaxID=28214 RepID=UPI003CC5FB71